MVVEHAGMNSVIPFITRRYLRWKIFYDIVSFKIVIALYTGTVCVFFLCKNFNVVIPFHFGNNPQHLLFPVITKLMRNSQLKNSSLQHTVGTGTGRYLLKKRFSEKTKTLHLAKMTHLSTFFIV